MTDPLQELLATGTIPTTPHPATSRYALTPIETLDPGDGREPVPYLGRRLVPQPDRFSILHEVRVVEGDRRDVLAHRHLGDAFAWWRLADSNGVVDPRALTDTVGRALRITLAEGIPGADDD